MNHGGHMDGMAMAPPPPAPLPSAAMHNATGGAGGMTMNHHHMMMHMTFFWGKNTEILFSGWPGYDNLGMYILALIVVFFTAIFVEFLSHSSYINDNTINVDHVVVGLLQTTLYGLRIGLGYVVMLAVMSFNGGVFLVAIVGHSLGFLVFGSRVFKKSSSGEKKNLDLPPMSCSC